MFIRVKKSDFVRKKRIDNSACKQLSDCSQALTGTQCVKKPILMGEINGFLKSLFLGFLVFR